MARRPLPEQFRPKNITPAAEPLPEPTNVPVEFEPAAASDEPRATSDEQTATSPEKAPANSKRLDLPFSSEPYAGYRPREVLVEFRFRVGLDRQAALGRVLRGLQDKGAKLSDGTIIDDYQDALLYILDQLL